MLVVRMSLSELCRATRMFQCSCSMGNRDRARGRTGILVALAAALLLGAGYGYLQWVSTAQAPAFDWLTANAPGFGWVHPAWAQPSGSKPEPWRWEFGSIS